MITPSNVLTLIDQKVVYRDSTGIVIDHKYNWILVQFYHRLSDTWLHINDVTFLNCYIIEHA